MKLLLSSNGFSDQGISDALFELIGKNPENTNLVFIPTASNVVTGDKDWLIHDLINIDKQGFRSVAITDISAVPEKIWKPQLEEADVLFFEGGNEHFLMHWINESGLINFLPEMLKSKVYMGLSAGSMVAGPDLDLRVTGIYGDGIEAVSTAGLGLVDFYFLPHLNNPYFPARIEANFNEAMKGVARKTYVLDDQSALKVIDGKVEHVGRGKYSEFN